jgi:hypothetical protein
MDEEHLGQNSGHVVLEVVEPLAVFTHHARVTSATARPV